MRGDFNAGSATDGPNKLQTLGLDLVNDLHMYIRSLHLYKSDNQIFLRPLNRMESTINWLIAREGKMHLYGTSSTLYLNDQMLRFRVASLSNVNFLLEELSKRDIGGLLIDKPVNQKQLEAFLHHFSDKDSTSQGGHSVIQVEPLEIVSARLKEVARTEIEGIESLKADSQQYAFLLYHRLYRFVEKLYDPKRDTEPSMSQATRILQEFIDLATKHDLDFLGFAEELNKDSYDIYHVCNVAISSVLFGKHLGISRLKLLDLGMAALRHNLGKFRIDERILEKKESLTKKEYALLKKIPLLTAKELLSGHFSWDRLRHAITIAHIHQPYREPLQPGGSTEPKGPWLFSRILHLSSCFDSLCTDRPFRPKLQPAEALLFMQKRMKEEFDPFLLRKFVMMFGKVAIRALKKKIDPSDLPMEHRDVPEQEVLFMGGAHEDELDEYWQLRQLPFLTEKQDERLLFLEGLIDAMHTGHLDDFLEDGVKTFAFEETPG